MAWKIRERKKSSKVFTSMQQSNKERDNYYDAMHKDYLRIQEDILNSIVISAIKNTDNLYYHQAMKSPNTI